jgi:hypothetical protein
VCVGSWLRKKLSSWLLGCFVGRSLFDASLGVLSVVEFEAQGESTKKRKTPN